MDTVAVSKAGIAARRKVSRTYRLAPATILAAQRALGAATATQAIEMALDLVLFRTELARGARVLMGTVIEPPTEDE